MNIIKELESLRDEVMSINGAEDKVRARNHIDRLIAENQKKDFEVPEWLTVKAEGIG